VSDPDGKERDTAEIVPLVTNDSEVPAEWAVIDLFIDKRLTLDPSVDAIFGLRRESELPFDTENGSISCARFGYTYGANQVPIFLGLLLRFLPLPLRLTIPLENGRYLMGWRVRSPRMQEAFGDMFITRTPDPEPVALETGTDQPA
jgi:hypothetical protein